MFLYLVSNSGYDTYNYHVISADTPLRAIQAAKRVDRDGQYDITDVELIGTSNRGPEVILSSFNAG